MPLEAIQPGATALTRTPNDAHSNDAVIVRLLMPARAAPECAMPGMPLRKSAVMLTMAPPCCWKLCRNSSRIIRKPPVRLLATTASKPRLLMAIIGAGNWPPALLTRPCTTPSLATTSATLALTASSSRMSNARQAQRPPSSRISAATRSSLSALRPLMTTSAPSDASSCATARPMPEPPPVTQMRWPANRPGANTLR